MIFNILYSHTHTLRHKLCSAVVCGHFVFSSSFFISFSLLCLCYRGQCIHSSRSLYTQPRRMHHFILSAYDFAVISICCTVPWNAVEIMAVKENLWTKYWRSVVWFLSEAAVHALFMWRINNKIKITITYIVFCSTSVGFKRPKWNCKKKMALCVTREPVASSLHLCTYKYCQIRSQCMPSRRDDDHKWVRARRRILKCLADIFILMERNNETVQWAADCEPRPRRQY